MFLFFLPMLNGGLPAQNATPDPGAVGSFFVKKNILQKTGALNVNIIRIFNRSDKPVKIKPVLNVPKGWAVFGASLVETDIPPHDTVSLSFSLRMPANAPAEVLNRITFQAFSQNNRLLHEDFFTVEAEPFHKWDVEVPDRRFYFYPRMNKADFTIRLVNQGNTPETIHIEVRPDKKLTVECTGGGELIRDITLPANSDSSLLFSASYTYNKERIFDISKIQVFASGNGTNLYRAVILEKYDDTYAPVHISRNLPHEIEAGIRTFKNNEEFLPYIKASGLADFNRKGMLAYNFTYHDLTQTENVIGNTYYRFLYSRNALNVGLGAFSSTLGRNLYSRNCLMFSNEMALSPSSKLKGYASFGYIEPKTSAAVGYNYDKNDFSMRTAVAYDMDIDRKITTGSFMHRFEKIRLLPTHVLTGAVYSYYEKHSLNKTYTLAGIGWDIRYSGKFGKRFLLQLSNNYGSPEIPGPQMGLLTFDGLAKYHFTQSRYLSLNYNNSSRDYSIRNDEGVKLPQVSLSDQYGRLFYVSNVHRNYKWSIGPSVEMYRSQNPLIGLGDTKDFNLRKYRLEYRALFGRHLRMTLKGGISQEMKTNKEDSETYDFHLLGDYANKGYGIRFTYDYGPMVNSGLYQYALDVGNNALVVSPYLIKNYLGGIFRVTMFTNFTYRIDMEYASLNINPNVESYVYKDWYLVLGGTYNFTSQVYNERTYNRSFYFLEFAVKKRWGKSAKDKGKQEVVRMRVQFFRDDNGNGVRDGNETGVPYVKTRILLKNSPDAEVRQTLPVDITLLSNENGNCTFNRIPKGFYEVYITPLADVNEYFYVNKTAERVEVLQNTTVEIPFQKANKIVGQIIVKRRKFISKDEENLDLKNIRITAYNKKGNSYSAFTDEQGRFVLFAPGGLTYFVRTENVFGSNFKILQNDISTHLTDSIGSPVIFNVVETSRKLNIKKAGSTGDQYRRKQIQKIKILSGEVYDGSASRNRVDKNAAPDFDIQRAQDSFHEMIPGKFYVVTGKANKREDAEKVARVLREMGISAYTGIDDYSQTWYVFTGFYNSRALARNAMNDLKKKKVKDVYVLEFNPEE